MQAKQLYEYHWKCEKNSYYYRNYFKINVLFYVLLVQNGNGALTTSSVTVYMMQFDM